MNKKIICCLLIILTTFIITGCNSKRINNNISEAVKTMKVIINNNEYIVNLENNEAVASFLDLLPKEFNMSELNGNEKYVYLDESLPSKSSNIGKINKGDVMLYGDDCLVIFYKSFNTSYSYTKIGHIDNLPDLGNGSVKVKFIK